LLCLLFALAAADPYVVTPATSAPAQWSAGKYQDLHVYVGDTLSVDVALFHTFHTFPQIINGVWQPLLARDTYIRCDFSNQTTARRLDAWNIPSAIPGDYFLATGVTLVNPTPGNFLLTTTYRFSDADIDVGNTNVGVVGFACAVDPHCEDGMRFQAIVRPAPAHYTPKIVHVNPEAGQWTIGSFNDLQMGAGDSIKFQTHEHSEGHDVWVYDGEPPSRCDWTTGNHNKISQVANKFDLLAGVTWTPPHTGKFFFMCNTPIDTIVSPDPRYFSTNPFNNAENPPQIKFLIPGIGKASVHCFVGMAFAVNVIDQGNSPVTLKAIGYYAPTNLN